MRRDLDAVMADLLAVRDRLDALGPGEVESRNELLEWREELRAEARAAHAAADPEGTVARLRYELAGLIQRWEELAGMRIDVVKHAGGTQVGGDFGRTVDAMRINREIDAAGGRAEIEARVARIRARLEELEA